MTKAQIIGGKITIDGVEYIIFYHDDCNTCLKHYYILMEAMDEEMITLDVDYERHRELVFNLKQHVETHKTLLNGHKCFECDNETYGKCELCNKHICYKHIKCCGACGENLCSVHETTECQENEKHAFIQ